MKDILLYTAIGNCLKLAFHHCANDNRHKFEDVYSIKIDCKTAGIFHSRHYKFIDVFDGETGEMITAVSYRMSRTGGIILTFVEDFNIPEEWRGGYASPCLLAWSFDGVQYYADPRVD